VRRVLARSGRSSGRFAFALRDGQVSVVRCDGPRAAIRRRDRLVHGRMRSVSSTGLVGMCPRDRAMRACGAGSSRPGSPRSGEEQCRNCAHHGDHRHKASQTGTPRLLPVRGPGSVCEERRSACSWVGSVPNSCPTLRNLPPELARTDVPGEELRQSVVVRTRQPGGRRTSHTGSHARSPFLTSYLILACDRC
jgi:hypothetical protein